MERKIPRKVRARAAVIRLDWSPTPGEPPPSSSSPSVFDWAIIWSFFPIGWKNGGSRARMWVRVFDELFSPRPYPKRLSKHPSFVFFYRTVFIGINAQPRKFFPRGHLENGKNRVPLFEPSVNRRPWERWPCFSFGSAIQIDFCELYRSLAINNQIVSHCRATGLTSYLEYVFVLFPDCGDEGSEDLTDICDHWQREWDPHYGEQNAKHSPRRRNGGDVSITCEKICLTIRKTE